jgi:hypothetical protein
VASPSAAVLRCRTLALRDKGVRLSRQRHGCTGSQA